MILISFRWQAERVLVALAVLPGLSVSNCVAVQSVPVTNAVTAATVLADLHYEKVVAAHLLAFTSREDKRPWYVDDALLLLELPKGEWLLVHAVRNPRDPAELKRKPSKWTVHHVMDAPHVGDRTFNHRPVQEEMAQFLKDNEWQPASDKYWQVVRSEVNEAVWRKVLGYNSPWLKTPKPPAEKLLNRIQSK